MDDQEISPKSFKKVKGKKNLYRNNNPLLDSPNNKINIKDNESNKNNKKAITDKNLDFVNNSDFIKEAVAYSRLKNLKKNLAYKNNNDNNDLVNTFSQRDNNKIKNIEKDNEINRKKHNKKIVYDLKRFNTSDYNNNRYNSYNLNNNEFISNTGKNYNNENKLFEYSIDMNQIKNKSVREKYKNKNNTNKLKNDENNNYGMTERKKQISIVKIFENKKINKNK